jgi:hypothetical protein
MRKIFVVFGLFVVIIGCAHSSETVLKDTDYLKYGTRASVIQKVWGKPDETMAFQDYRAKGYYYHGGVVGSWDSFGGSVSGYGLGTTYIPTTIVWIYKQKGKALFFQKRGLMDEPHTAIMVWKLVGWEDIRPEKASLEDDELAARMKYVERKIKEAGITSDSDVRIFWAIVQKAPKEMPFEDQVEWAIKRTKEVK